MTAAQQNESVMKFTIDRTPLLRALARVRPVVDAQPEIPILASVLLTAEDNNLCICAANRTFEVTDVVPVEIDSPGSCAVPALTLCDVIRQVTDGAMIEFGISGPKLVIRAGRSRTSLPALPGDMFPPALACAGTTFDTPGSALSDLLDFVLHAAATDDPRRYLTGVYLHEVAGGLRSAATDGRRLAVCASESTCAGMPGVILPRVAVPEIVRVAEAAGESIVSISVSPTVFAVRFGTSGLSTRLVDGTFPDYRRVIPLGLDKSVEVGAAEMRRAVGRVVAVAGGRGQVMDVAVSEGWVRLLLDDPSGASAEEEVDAEYEGDDVSVLLNSRMLLEALEHVRGEVATIKMADGGTPVVVTDGDRPGALEVLMPMRRDQGV